MRQEHNKDPLHGITLKKVLETLLEHYTWKQLFYQVKINCFRNDPSINSSLKFLRKNEWARKEVEAIYVELAKNGFQSSRSTGTSGQTPWFKKKRKDISERPDWMDMI